MDTTSSVGIIYFLLIFVVSIFFHVMLLAIPVVMYFFRAYSLYRIAKRNHHPHPAIAWFPLANEFLFADLVGKNVKMGSIRISQFPTVRVAAPSVFVWLYIVLYFCVIFLNSAPLALFLFLFYVLWKIAYFVFNIYSRNLFFKKYKPDRPTLYTFLSTIFPLAFEIILFTMRNTKDANKLD